MQKELQFTLSIIGILIIGGVLLHGMWTIRKNSKKQKKSQYESRNWEPSIEDEGFDDDETLYDDVGVSKARVVVSDPEDDVEKIPMQKVTKDAHITSFDKPVTHDKVSRDDLSLSLGNQGDDDEAIDESLFASIDSWDERQSDADVKEGKESSALNSSDLDSSGMAQNSALDTEKHESEIQTAKTTPETEVAISSKANHKHMESPIYSNVVTQPKPEYTKSSATGSEDAFGQPPGFLLKKEDGERKLDENTMIASDAQESDESESEKQEENPDFSLRMQEGPKAALDDNEDKVIEQAEKELSFAEQAKRFVRRNRKTVAEKIRKEPVLQDKDAADQMRMDFTDSDTSVSQDKHASKPIRENVQAEAKSSAIKDNGETDVLVLNVRANDDNPINGASLLPMLLTLGFKFGEHDIFHRHVNTNGKGPILFSLTNMFKPGIFDIDNIENFSTHGLSLFMMLPIEGDAQQVFNMMHNAARKLSDEFDCRILDGNRVGLSKQSLQQYIERIREFERRRMSS